MRFSLVARRSSRGRLKATDSAAVVTTSTVDGEALCKGVDHLLDQHFRRRGAGA